MSDQSGGAFLPSDNARIKGLWTFEQAPVQSSTVVGVTPLSSTVSATEYVWGPMHQTVITLTNLAMAVNDTHFGGGSKIYTFPAGDIAVIGATATVAETTTSTIATTLKASKTLSVGVGSVVTSTQDSGVPLVTTQQDIVSAFAATSSATINVAGTAVNGRLSATTLLRYDGTSTAQAVYLNCSVATGDIDGDATTTWSGTVTINWFYNGDY